MTKFILTIILLVIAVPALLIAQPKMKIMRQGPGGNNVREMTEESMLHVPELSAMIIEDGKDLVVDHIMEPEMRMKGYEKTDLQEGDKILMANGKKVASVKGLKELYSSAKIGETVKFGVKRKDEMMIASFAKADQKDLPKMRMMIAGGDGEDQDILGIPQVGLLFGNKGKDVIVKALLPEASEKLKGVDVKEGDVVTTFNTFTVKSFGDFQKRYENIPVGDKIELIVSRSGKTQTVTFMKPKQEGKMIIRRKD